MQYTQIYILETTNLEWFISIEICILWNCTNKYLIQKNECYWSEIMLIINKNKGDAESQGVDGNVEWYIITLLAYTDTSAILIATHISFIYHGIRQ